MGPWDQGDSYTTYMVIAGDILMGIKRRKQNRWSDADFLLLTVTGAVMAVLEVWPSE